MADILSGFFKAGEISRDPLSSLVSGLFGGMPSASGTVNWVSAPSGGSVTVPAGSSPAQNLYSNAMQAGNGNVGMGLGKIFISPTEGILSGLGQGLKGLIGGAGEGIGTGAQSALTGIGTGLGAGGQSALTGLGGGLGAGGQAALTGLGAGAGSGLYYLLGGGGAGLGAGGQAAIGGVSSGLSDAFSSLLPLIIIGVGIFILYKVL